jgi:hypothetical protein
LNSPADIWPSDGNPKNSTGCDETTLPTEFIAVCVLAFVAGVMKRNLRLVATWE